MSEHTILYRYFDTDDRLLYVGITKDQSKRFSSHNRYSKWMKYASYCTLEHFESRDLAKQAETIAIQEEQPIHNVAETMRANTWRLSAECHLIQLLGSPDDGWDNLHRDFASDLPITMRSIPNNQKLDSLEFVGIAYDFLRSKKDKNYPNLEFCPSCFEMSNDKTIESAIQSAKAKLQKEKTK